VFGWCLSSLCLLQLPIWAVITIMKQEEKTLLEKIINAFKPNSEWGPNDVEKSELQQVKTFYPHYF
jgi:hypothetical protein